MTPAEVYRLLARWGHAVTLRRPGTPDVDATVKAHLRGGAPEDLEADRHVAAKTCVVAAADPGLASWPVPPAAGDQVVIGADRYIVTGVEARPIGAADARWDLTLRGPM